MLWTAFSMRLPEANQRRQSAPAPNDRSGSKAEIRTETIPPNEQTRQVAEEGVNLVVDYLLEGLPTKPKKSFVLGTFKHFLRGFERFDSEERAQTLYYLNRLMEIVGVRSSNELLNVWRYGFPVGWLLKGA